MIDSGMTEGGVREGVDPRTTIAAAMARFRPLPRAERYGRTSLWTMYYLGALIVPAIATGVRTGRVPATAIDALTCSIDAEGHVVGFRPRPGADRSRRDFDELIEGHLAIMIADCANLAGFPARVAWSNAAVIIDYAIGEARRIDGARGAALGAAEALIADSGHPRLANPYRPGARHARRICCLRYLMPNGTLCPDICPRAVSARDTNRGNLPATSTLTSR